MLLISLCQASILRRFFPLLFEHSIYMAYSFGEPFYINYLYSRINSTDQLSYQCVLCDFFGWQDDM